MRMMILQVSSLWLRDMRHFFRQPSRVAGALGQPVLVWVLLAAGFQNSFVLPGDAGLSYGAYLYPGIIVLIALFASIFSTISIIEDRRSGFLQGVLVAPVARPVFVLAKLIAGGTLALAQAALFLLLLPYASLPVSLSGLLLGLVVLLFIGMTMTNLGVLISWRMKSTQGFHAIMSLVLIPLWLLSGAFFPVDGAAPWMQWLIRLNPLHYLAVLFQDTLSSGLLRPVSGPDPATAFGVSAVFFVLLYVLSVKVTRTA